MDLLPPPLVADLNGDGRREVLLPTHDAKMQVLQLLAHAGLASAAALDGFHEARVMAEISLLLANVRYHGVEIFFWFFKLIVVAWVTETRYY